MRYVQIIDCPCRRAEGSSVHADPEERQFVTEASAVFRVQLPGVVPPFQFVIRMCPVIARKLILIAGNREPILGFEYLHGYWRLRIGPYRQ